MEVNKNPAQAPSKARLCRQLFLSFFKIGAFTFGGGYAMIPLIEHDIVENKHWLSADDLLEIIAIAESTPGPIAINAATFIGYRTAGVWGSVCATLGSVIPSLMIITAVSYLLKLFGDLRPVQYAFLGIRAAVLALIIKGWWSMAKRCSKTVLSVCVFLLAFVLLTFLKVPAVFIILGCAAIGLIVSLIVQKKQEADK